MKESASNLLSAAELAGAAPGSVDTQLIEFPGLRGDPARHLSRAALVAALAALSAGPRDQGRVELMVARGPQGERALPTSALLTREVGMPGDRWAGNGKYGPEYQLATMRIDFARVVANGQPLELHGDNLFLDLDVSVHNLPVGSRLRIGQALVEVTPQAHNGCKKWVQRFGLDAMQLNLDPEYRPLRLRGLYLRVIEDGLVSTGDQALVLARAG